MKASTKAFDELFKELIEEVQYLDDGLSKSDHPMTRRAYVRAVFALFEGVTHAMKQVALDHPWHTKSPFSNAEVAVLQEENYSLNDSGQAGIHSLSEFGIPPKPSFCILRIL